MSGPLAVAGGGGRRLHPWLVALVLLVAAPALASEKTRVVVLGIDGSTETLRRIGVSVSEQILTELGKTEALEAMGTSDVQALLGMERQKAMLGCSEQSTSCLAEMSAALGAPWLVTGTLAQFGKTTRLDIKLIRARDGKATFRDGVAFKDEGDLFDLVTGICKRMVKKMDLVEQPVAPRPPVVWPDAPVVVAPPPTVTPEVVVAAPVVTPASPVRVAPVVVAGAGVLVGLGGAALLVLGGQQRDEVTRALHSATPPLYSAARADLTSANTKSGAGVALAAAGVVAVGAGLGWFFLGAPAEAGSPAVSVGVGPGSFLVRGAF